MIVLKFLIVYALGDPYFHFAPNPANYLASRTLKITPEISSAHSDLKTA